MKLEPPANYGWKEIFHHHVARHHGWPTLLFPLPPPPPPVNPNSQAE